MLLTAATASAVLNVLVIAGVPFAGYAAVQRWRFRRSVGEAARRAGLQVGDGRYILFGAVVAVIAAGALLIWPPPAQLFQSADSPQRLFRGLGLAGPAIPMALLYGMVQTGFPEELFFRGILAGMLSRRLRPSWANVVQTGLFLTPHLVLLRGTSGLWTLTPAITVGSLFVGWLRIKSGSILGPWIVHSSVNTTICLVVAAGRVC